MTSLQLSLKLSSARKSPLSGHGDWWPKLHNSFYLLHASHLTILEITGFPDMVVHHLFSHRKLAYFVGRFTDRRFWMGVAIFCSASTVALLGKWRYHGDYRRMGTTDWRWMSPLGPMVLPLGASTGRSVNEIWKQQRTFFWGGGGDGDWLWCWCGTNLIIKVGWLLSLWGVRWSRGW